VEIALFVVPVLYVAKRMVMLFTRVGHASLSQLKGAAFMRIGQTVRARVLSVDT